MSEQQLDLIPDAGQQDEAPQPPVETSRERIERLTQEAMQGDPPSTDSPKAVDEHGYTREVETGRFAEPEEVERAIEEEIERTIEEEIEQEISEQVEEQLDPEVFEVELPARAEGQDPLTMKVSSQQEADHLNMLKNGFMRRQEFNRHMEQVRTDQSELQSIENALREDPAEFVISRTPTELQQQLAVTILTTMPDDQLNAVIDQLAGWERNPQLRQQEALRLQNERLQAQLQAREQQQVQAQYQDAATRIQRAVADLIPESFPQDKADRFYRMAIYSLQEHLRSNQLRSFAPEQVEPFLTQAGIMADYGITEDAVPSQPTGRQGTQTSVKPPTQKRAEQRRAAASVAPAGATAGATSAEKPPEGQTVRERMQWYRKQIGH